MGINEQRHIRPRLHIHIHTHTYTHTLTYTHANIHANAHKFLSRAHAGSDAEQGILVLRREGGAPLPSFAAGQILMQHPTRTNLQAMDKSDCEDHLLPRSDAPTRPQPSACRIIGGAALISGAMVGAGLLALPARTILGAGPGFIPSSFGLVMVALHLLATGILLAEAAFHGGAPPGGIT